MSESPNYFRRIAVFARSWGLISLSGAGRDVTSLASPRRRESKYNCGMKIVMNKAVIGLCFALLLGIVGCSRQQSDWEKTRAANTTDSYEQFIKKYPKGEFTAQAQARVKELYEEGDWQKARDADTQ